MGCATYIRSSQRLGFFLRTFFVRRVAQGEISLECALPREDRMYVAQPIQWTERGVVMLDQRRLPAEEITHTYTDYREVARAIREMVIRGAPAIGVAAAMGVALGVLHSAAKSIDELRAEFPQICDVIAKTRPTAVDLF